MNEMNEESLDHSFAPQPSPFTRLIGIIWSVHVLIAALLFPRSLLPSAEDERRAAIYKITSLTFGTLILLINILSIIVMFTRPNLIDTAKVIFIFLTWVMVGAIYILFNHLRDIYQLFASLEEEAIQSRDQSVMLIRAGQAALRSGNQRLFSQEDVQLSMTSLLKKIGPLALLFLQKEKNFFQIALEAGRLAVMGSRVFKSLF